MRKTLNYLIKFFKDMWSLKETEEEWNDRQW